MEEKDIKHVSVFDDDEIPYEVRMKHLIKAYRKDLKRLRELARYARGLEEENLILQKQIKNIGTWKVDGTNIEKAFSQMKSQISQLRGALTKSFPKRVIQMRDLQMKIIALEKYISELQSLLTANNIPFQERKVDDSSKAESIIPQDIDIFAVRGPKENFKIEEGYFYKYPRPSVTADCVVITRNPEPHVLLIERGNDPFKGCWAFPGGFMNIDETTEQCAIRELEEETGLKVSEVQQLGSYSEVNRDPRGRTITIAYLAILDEQENVKGQDDAANAQWFPLASLPELAYDHAEIMEDAIKKYKEIVK